MALLCDWWVSSRADGLASGSCTSRAPVRQGVRGSFHRPRGLLPLLGGFRPFDSYNRPCSEFHSGRMAVA